MKILVLFQFPNHNQTIDSLCRALTKKGMEVSSFNIATWRLKNWFRCNVPLQLRFLKFVVCLPKIRGLFSISYRDKALLRLSRDYDIIDIHFFSKFYDRLIVGLKERQKKVKITIWGSDFYRTSAARKEEQRKIYRLVDIIQIETEQIANDFLEVYPECEGKIRLAYFGISQFDLIDRFNEEGSRKDYRKKMHIGADMIVLTCGTNGSKAQQHLLMLEIIASLDAGIKEKLFLVIPVTYGGSDDYVDSIEKKARSLGIPYRIFRKFLPENETAVLRIISDILLIVQTTDALSLTFQEYMYAGNILIAGDWLPYGIVSEHGVSFITTGIDSLASTIAETILNYESEKESCHENKIRLAGLSSWDEAIRKWIHVYNEMKTK